MLEGIAAGHVSAETFGAKLAELYKDSGVGSPRAPAVKLAPLAGDEWPSGRTALEYAAEPRHDERLI